jgi:hypothetical protein
VRFGRTRASADGAGEHLNRAVGTPLVLAGAGVVVVVELVLAGAEVVVVVVEVVLAGDAVVVVGEPCNGLAGALAGEAAAMVTGLLAGLSVPVQLC